MAGTHTKTLIANYEKMPQKIQDYFQPCLKLMADEEMPWDVVISYMFTKIETAQRNTLSVGLRKIHKCEISLVWKAIDNEALFRDEFRLFFKKVFGKNISKETENLLQVPIEVRNKIMHGYSATTAEKKKAIACILVYCEQYNLEMKKIAGFEPFGSLQGVVGRSMPLNKSTTMWMLMGMGFLKKP